MNYDKFKVVLRFKHKHTMYYWKRSTSFTVLIRTIKTILST